VAPEESFLTEPGTISYDPGCDYMSCSCGNTDRLDGFEFLSDLSGLGRFRLFMLDWLVRFRIVPAGIASAVFTCAFCCGAVYYVTPRELRIAKNYHRRNSPPKAKLFCPKSGSVERGVRWTMLEDAWDDLGHPGSFFMPLPPGPTSGAPPSFFDFPKRSR
jgi:hypothetical protein